MENNTNSSANTSQDFETVDTNSYDSKAVAKATLGTLFPFTKEGREYLYGTIAFLFAAIFFAVPGVMSVLSFILPRTSFLNYISSQTRDAFFIVMYIGIGVFVWLLTGRIIDCASNKKPFLPYEGFKDLLKKNPVRIMFIAVLILMTVSCLLAQKKTEAFTNATDGAITWYTVALGVIIVSLVKDKKQIRLLLTVFTVSAVLTCFVMYVQYIIFYNKLPLDNIGDFFKLWSYDFTGITRDAVNLRHLRGVFSNSNHYGYYLTMSALAAAGLYITGDKPYKRILSALAFALIVFTTVLNDTLGTQLAVVIAACLLPIFFIGSKAHIIRRFVPMFIMICVMTGMSLFPKLPIGSESITNSIREIGGAIKTLTSYSESSEKSPSNDNSSVSSAPKSQKTMPLATYTEEILKEDDRWWLNHQELGSSRLGLWQYGIHLMVQKPLLGYGIYNTKALFEEESGLRSPAARVHNEYLQIGIDLGIPAMLIHLAAYIGVCIYFFSALKKKKLNCMQRILFGIFTAYAISALTGICAYYTASYFYILLGLLISTFEGSFHEYPEKELACADTNIENPTPDNGENIVIEIETDTEKPIDVTNDTDANSETDNPSE